MLDNEQIIEAIAEALRQARRNFVKPFDLGSVVIDEDTIELKVVDEGTVRTFYLNIEEEFEGDNADDTTHN